MFCCTVVADWSNSNQNIVIPDGKPLPNGSPLLTMLHSRSSLQWTVSLRAYSAVRDWRWSRFSCGLGNENKWTNASLAMAYSRKFVWNEPLFDNISSEKVELGSVHWRSRTRGVMCVRTPCHEMHNIWYISCKIILSVIRCYTFCPARVATKSPNLFLRNTVYCFDEKNDDDVNLR